LFAGTKRFLKTVLLAFIAISFVTFAVVNRDTVQLSLFPLPYMMAMPLFLFAMLTFIAGAVVGWLCARLHLGNLRGKFKAEHKRVMALENEISVLHNEKPADVPAVALPKI
jgi:uncharacterized integral membrane protein